MSALPDPKRWTVDAYLAFEETSETKHEYVNGEVYAMSGASPNHNRITMSTGSSLNNQLRKRPCDVFGGDQRVRLNDLHYIYPDLSIICGDPEFDNEKPQSLLNPTILIEVSSSSTARYDHEVKAPQFRARSSVQEYLLIAQDKVQIEHYVRQTDNKWLLTDISQLDATIELTSIQCTLAVADIYEKVNFDDVPT